MNINKENDMNEQIIFTKDNLLVNSLEYDAEPSGNGLIHLHLGGGSIEIDVESYLGNVEITNYSYVSNIVDGKFHFYYLDDESIETVREYMKENDIFNKYMDEVYEAVSQTF